jgi:uncharacterized protein DUF3300
MKFQLEFPGNRWRDVARPARQGLSLVLSALMVVVPMGQSAAYAQEPLPGVAPLEEQQQQAQSDYDRNDDRPYDDRDDDRNYDRNYDNRNYDQPGAPGQALSAEQLDQLVAPIALYPDSLIAQILAASTYPTQVVEANRWLKAQGSIPNSEIAARVDEQPWDPSVKALTAFPTVLERMDRNLQWTTDLGNAYYNQPQDVMAAIQELRRQAQDAGNLRDTQQLDVREEDDAIAIYPANPAVVYVPVYDPWAVWGYPLVPYPGFWYYPGPGIYWSGLIGFGFGINIGWWGGWGWGWNNWGCGWRHRSVFFHHRSYWTRSTTVFNRGLVRPGSPPRVLAGQRGSFVNHGFTRTSSGSFVRSGGGLSGSAMLRGGASGSGVSRGGAALGRGGGATGFNRGGGGAVMRGGGGGAVMRGGGGGAVMRGGGGSSGAMMRGGTTGRSQGSFDRGGMVNRGSGGGRPFVGSPSGSMSRPSGPSASRPSVSGGGGFGGGRSMGGGARMGGGAPMGGGGHVSGGGSHGGGGGGFGGGGHGGGGGGHGGGGGLGGGRGR